MGDSVVLGALASGKDCEEALAEACRAPAAFCIQERFEFRPLMFGAGVLYPAGGAYLVDGRFAGYNRRAASRPFLTQEAFHEATLVETA